MRSLETGNNVPALLGALVRQLGEGTVAGALGCSEDGLQDILDGSGDIEDEARRNLEDLCELLNDSAGWADLSSQVLAAPLTEVVAPEVGAVPPPELGLDILPSEEEEFLSEVPTAAVRPGETWREEMERTRDSLRRARALAVMTQFRQGMSERERVSSLGLVQEIELALITLFGDSVPEPGEYWNSERRAREQGIRIERLMWVEKMQRREWSGLRGAWNWALGRERLTGADLYNKILEDADAMLLAMTGAPPMTPEMMQHVMRYSGVVRN